jgi:Ca2+-binding RTX toxin-like protein
MWSKIKTGAKVARRGAKSLWKQTWNILNEFGNWILGIPSFVAESRAAQFGLSKSVVTRGVLVGALGALVATTVVIPTSVHAHEGPNAWVHEYEAGQESVRAEIQRPAHCEGIAGLPLGTDPSWVRVDGSIDPNTPFVQASGQLLPDAEDNQNPRIATNDTWWSHFSKDLNVWLTLDRGPLTSPYWDLLADGNFHQSGHREHGKLEIEVERGGVPLFAFPATGDRMTVWGPHIWDCPHNDGYDMHDSYRTEIHPAVGWVVYRNTADSDGLPDNDEKRTQDPWLWYGPGDRQGTAARFSQTGNVAIRATVADVFLSSFGGDAVEDLNGYNTDQFGVVGTPEDHWRQLVLSRDYTFFIPAPPSPPTRAATMIWEQEDRCGLVPHNPGNPPFDDVEEVYEAGEPGDPEAEDLGAPACTIPADVQVTTDDYGHPGIRVTVRAHSSGVPYPANEYIAFARRYKVGWLAPGPLLQRGRIVRVDFERLRVFHDNDPCWEDGEWVMSIRVNDAWIHPVRGRGDGGEPFWTDGAINDARCPLVPGDYKDYPIGQSVTVTVAPDQPIHVWERSYDLTPVHGLGDNNPVLNRFPIVPTSPRQYISRVGAGEQGDHALIYTVTDITPRCQGELGTLVGTSGADVLVGGPGRDVIVGQGGGDRIDGGGGDDFICGGSGNDFLLGGDGNDRLVGEAWNDRLAGGNGADLLDGGDGADIADYSERGASVAVTIDGLANDGELGEGDDVRSNVEKVWGGSGSDALTGSPSNNALIGGAGSDTLNGGLGFDTLDGGDGYDQLDGGRGDDTLLGGLGFDILNGGFGEDVCDVGPGGGITQNCED